MLKGISLANKCLLLFGCAVAMILLAALSVPWVRTYTLVRQYQLESARQIADAWLDDRIRLGSLESASTLPTLIEDLLDDDREMLRVAYSPVDEIERSDPSSSFLLDALQAFREDPDLEQHIVFGVAPGDMDDRHYHRYARPIRASRLRTIQHEGVAEFSPGAVEPGLADPLVAILLVDRTSQFAAGQWLLAQVHIIAAGLVASLLAVFVFHLILTRLIFRPVRRLRVTTEAVQGGDLTVRTRIATGDEFELLADSFNAMLDEVEGAQVALRRMNENLDLKVTELATANVGLFESSRLKSEFLANVSHELRTPLNAIIGFAELLHELASSESGADPKRQRYLRNILHGGRSLLEMINELLDMAKIEAGRMEVHPESTSISDLVEGLTGIMGPQAGAKGLSLETQLGPNLPVIETDPGKLQQILFNFLSNAIKFTPVDGRITISAERLIRQDNSARVRISVADTGPGIPEDMQDVIFEKFRQIDASHTREHPGTGLGLAICRELADLLRAEVSFVSVPGGGATFYVDLPSALRSPKPRTPVPINAIQGPVPARSRATGA